MLKVTFCILLLTSLAAADETLRTAVDGYLAAAEDPTLDPVTATATRSRLLEFDAPFSAPTVGGERMRRQSYRTTPQALRDIPGVMVQETAFGQGSPFVRGFTGFRTLLLIDGIRLNNSVFRDGPNQYWNTVDAHSLDRLELVKGPSSVLYGSDAIGGTVQAFTRDPYAYREEGFGHAGRLSYRFAGAEESHTGRGEYSGAFGETTGVVAGLTGRTFGDLEAGDPLGTQTDTGYDDWAGDLKIEHFLDPDTRVVAAYQHVRLNNVPRTHRTVVAKSFHGTTVGSELQRDLDQERWLAYLQFHKEKMSGAFEAVRVSLSWHSQTEVRHRIRPPSGGGPGPDRVDFQGFDVGTLGFWVQLASDTVVGRLTYGIEIYHDNVNSFSSSNPVQGPVADEATYDLIGLYVQSEIAAGSRVDVIVGVRVTYAAADADGVSDPDTGAAFALSDDWTAVVGSVRAVYRLVEERWNLFGGVSQGFRAPNLSDLTRFDTARSNEFEIPAPGLDPEHYVTFELGLKGRAGRFRVEVATFYTVVRDQIVRVPTGMTNMDGDAQVTKANVGDGWVYGVELTGSVVVVEQVTLFGNLTWLQGKVDTFPTSAPVVVREYLDRLMPLTAQVGARWEDPGERFWAEAVAVMADKADRLSTRDASDTQRIPPGGTPGYGVVHLRGGWRIRPKAHLIVALENIFDKSYRVHGSGHNRPGRNLVVSFNLDF